MILGFKKGKNKHGCIQITLKKICKSMSAVAVEHRKQQKKKKNVYTQLHSCPLNLGCAITGIGSMLKSYRGHTSING